MSTQYSPRIITDGLVSLFDGANPKSFYSGSSKWIDLTGTSNGTFTNSPYYTSSYGGGVGFNGYNMSVAFNNPLNQSNLSQEWTVDAWCMVATGAFNDQLLISGLNQGIAADWYRRAPLLYLNGGANDYYLYGSSGSYLGDGIMNLTFRFKNATGARYITRNGVDISGTGPNDTSTPSGQASVFSMGYHLSGSIHQLKIYNRFITDSEVAQNYQAVKGRFGM